MLWSGFSFLAKFRLTHTHTHKAIRKSDPLNAASRTKCTFRRYFFPWLHFIIAFELNHSMELRLEFEWERVCHFHAFPCSLPYVPNRIIANIRPMRKNSAWFSFTLGHCIRWALHLHTIAWEARKKLNATFCLTKGEDATGHRKTDPPVYSYRICQNEWTLAVAILISPAIRYQLNRSFCNRRVCSALLSPCERVCYESGYMKPPPPPSPPLTFNSIHEKISYTSSLFLRR